MDHSKGNTFDSMKEIGYHALEMSGFFGHALLKGYYDLFPHERPKEEE